MKSSDPLAGLPNQYDVCDNVPTLDDVSDGLHELDLTPDYDFDEHPEIDPHLRLSKDRTFKRTPTRRLFADYRANPDAFRHLAELPAAGETHHMVISGKYALWDLVPATLERSGDTIDELYLATLGFSRQNGAEMFGLLDDKQIGRLTLIPSHYFQGTSGPIYDAVVPELLRRGQTVCAIRNHAKLILMAMHDGTKYVIDSSANLRSCVNIETANFHNCPELYDFHREWIESEIVKVMSRRRANSEE